MEYYLKEGNNVRIQQQRLFGMNNITVLVKKIEVWQIKKGFLFQSFQFQYLSSYF